LLGLEFLTFSLALKGVPNRSYGQTSVCRTSDATVTFYNHCFLTMPSTCSIRLLYWNYAEQFACSLIFKTSFSRLDPIPRGQATAIKSSVRHRPEGQ
jgi:hypothetical protein